MTKLYKEVIAAIQAKKCEVHHQHPFIGVTEGKAVLITCCTAFKILCYTEMVIKLSDKKKQPLKVAWKRPAKY